MAQTPGAGVLGSTLTLIVSPPWSEAVDRACLERVIDGDPRDRNVLVLSFHRPADVVVDDLRRCIGERPRNLAVIDVRNAMRSATAASQGPERPGIPNVVASLADPRDVEAMLSTATRYLDDWEADGGRTVVYVDSVTDVIYRVGPVTAVSYIESLRGVLSASSRGGFFRLDGDVHDTSTLALLDPRFDRVERMEGDRWTELDSAAAALSPTTPPRAPLSADALFGALEDPRRRLLLHGLRLAGGTASISELAGFVESREDGVDAPSAEEARRRIYTGLRHVHLPALDELGIITVHEDAATVELGPQRRLEPYLSLTVTGDLYE